ncbi:uncharacterized protein LY89DRAFT_789630 [Mollisia scopiformis]|uniref:Uncharacterized protein n=1 Tax=Mollisia scopiformis TaxID=149040 RepID=A0A132B572_MOLSC|nr:uncharacterized protein LY89DRAFT_789630 [Mollisia scopiformis]KUJ07552.1 hypothetical protein LY89DRAFT_789630 [Mollisia scopiformis]
MKFITAFVLSVASLASAGSIHINYYTDGGCSDYLVSPPNVPTDGSCYTYQYGGTNSANIANCNGFGGCYCDFYEYSNCEGLSEPAGTPDGPDCASNYGIGFASFQCYTD